MNPAVLEQRIGRIYRLGQHRPIAVYSLVSEPGIESRISDLVGTKQAFFVGLFDLAFERSGSFLSRIERIVTPALERAPARGVEAVESEDGPAEREIDALVAAGDESRDTRVPAASEPAPPPSAGDVQKLFAGLTVQRTAHGGLAIEAPPETAATLAALFAGMAQLLEAAAQPSAGRGRSAVLGPGARFASGSRRLTTFARLPSVDQRSVAARTGLLFPPQIHYHARICAHGEVAEHSC